MDNFQIKVVSEREMWVGMNKVVLLDNGIIHVTANGDQTPEIAKLQFEVNQRFSVMVKGKANYLINLNRCGKNPPEARKIWNRINESEKTGKVAAVGIHPVARVLASFVIKFSIRKDMRFFETEKEAFKWLTE